MEYQLEIKQIVDYPRCRIYRMFMRRLMEDINIRTNGNSYLFYFMVLCSYANFRTSYRRLDGITYLIGPGEWICTPSELSRWFRTRFQHQAVTILDYLQHQHYITYSLLDRGQLVKFHITDWKANNTSLEYNYPCQKDAGFFFFPVAAVHELISVGKCSEMDIVLDLWIHAIYNDIQVQGSDIGPVVYFRNHTGNPLLNYRNLACRWGISKASVSRLIKKLEIQQYITAVSFTGTHGSVLYLQNYLSTMFNISDVMIDKEEISLSFQIPISIQEEDLQTMENDATKNLSQEPVKDEQIYVPENENSVSKPHMKKMVRKVAAILAAQGVPCCECSKTKYKLYRLSDCGRDIYRYSLHIDCPESSTGYQFELRIQPIPSEAAARKKETYCDTAPTRQEENS